MEQVTSVLLETAEQNGGLQKSYDVFDRAAKAKMLETMERIARRTAWSQLNINLKNADDIYIIFFFLRANCCRRRRRSSLYNERCNSQWDHWLRNSVVGQQLIPDIRSRFFSFWFAVVFVYLFILSIVWPATNDTTIGLYIWDLWRGLFVESRQRHLLQL